MLIEDRLKHKILSPSEVINFVIEHRAQGDKIIFTNGCFDLVHLGHLEYLLKAKELGGVLMVGINSDQSVRTIKGDKRPIISETQRYHNLASYYFVDAVVPFSDETPLNLIKTISQKYLLLIQYC